MANFASSVQSWARLGWALVVLATACTSTSGGGGGAAGVTIGGPCNSATQKELCNGTARLACTANVWTILATCPTGQKCVVTPAADGKGMQSGCLDSGGNGDAVSGDATADVPAMDVAPDTSEVIGTDAIATDDGACTNGQPCDDGDGCTQSDTCTGGVCHGKAKNCDDSDPCTADSCSGGSCQHAPISCNDGASMATAVPLTSNKAQADSLVPTGGSRWFQFDGSAGDFVLLATQTAQVANQYDDTIIDTVITLYDPDQQPVAMNDDSLGSATPDSELWSKLAKTGTYYVEVSECWTWVAANPGAQITCGGTANKSDTQFSVYYDDVQVDPLPGVAFESESNNTLANANLLAYVKANTGLYFAEMLLGDLGNGADKDYYGFSVPTDVKVSQGRLTAGFSLLPAGAMGDGSPLTGVTATLVNATNNQVLAVLDLDGNDLRVPVQNKGSGASYAVLIQHNSSSYTTQDWYVVQHTLGGSNPMETSEAQNNAFSGAESLKAASSTAQAVDYFIGGDIIDGGADVDYFSVNVPSGMTKITVSCGSKYMGSGVVDFAVQVFTAGNAEMTGGPQVESSSAISLKNLAIPYPSSKLILKLSAGGQSSGIAGTFYECGVHLTAVAAP